MDDHPYDEHDGNGTPPNDALEGKQRAMDGLLRELVRAGEGDDEHFIAEVMGRIHPDADPVVPQEPTWSWFGGFKFWQAAAAALIVVIAGTAFRGWTVHTAQAEPAEVFLYGQPELTPGHPAAFRVYVRDGRDQTPLANAEVEVALRAETGRRIELGATRTDQQGFALAETALPEDLEEGDYTIEVKAVSSKGTSRVDRHVLVQRSYRTMLSTDKPLYQPGQVIHLRALSLAVSDLKPAADRDVVFEVQDPKGNKVFKKTLATSAFGIAAADFQLADQVHMGSYTVSATVDDTVTERSVDVRRYTLPKYTVALKMDKGFYAPGDRVSADLTATYTFGQPVANARVQITASEFVERFRAFANIEGETDAHGNFRFELELKDHFVGQDLKKGDAIVRLEAAVIDGAGLVGRKSSNLTVTGRPIRIEVFPESGELVQGVENVLYIMTVYPDGQPARTQVQVGANRESIETSAMGIAKVMITPKKRQLKLTLRAEDARGVSARVERRLRVGEQVHDFLLRTDKAVYRQGETVGVEIVSAQAKARMFVDIVKDNRTFVMKSVDVRDGRGHLALDLPLDVMGTLELHAYRILPNGQIVEDNKLIQVNRADALDVSVALDKKTYRPAEKAVLDFVVKGRDGTPAQAALSLAVVDEAVFALNDMRPGLETLYFLLQEEILKPRYEIHAHMPLALRDTVCDRPPEPEPEWEEAEVVLFASSKGDGTPKVNSGRSYAEKVSEVRQAKRAYGERLSAGVATMPFWGFLLIMLPVLGYVVLKLFRRTPVADLPPADAAALRRRALFMFWATVGAIYLPLLGALGTAFIVNAVNARVQEEFVLAILIALACIGLAALVVAAVRLARCRGVRALPAYRRVVIAVPVAFLVGCLATAGIIFAANAFDDALGGGTAIAMFLVTALLFMQSTAVVSLGAQCALRTVSLGRFAWILFSRISIWAPVTLVCLAPFLMMGGMAAAPDQAMVAMNRADGIRFSVPTDAVMAPGEAPPAAGHASSAPRVRKFFPETLYWQPQLITDNQGRARLELPLADSITTWRMAGSAVTAGGQLGSLEQGITVFQDFFIDIDFPEALTQNDEVSVPVAVFNYLDEPQIVRLEAEPGDWCDLLDGPTRELRIGARGVTHVHYRVRAKTPGRHALTVKATGSSLSDAVRRTVRVTPDGEAFVQTVNGRLDENRIHEFAIPEEAIAGASDLFVKIYPGAFSQVVEGMDSIFRMPHGCFEQTSSTTYPNILVLDYLRRTKQARPDVEMKAANFINIGYQRLLSYECRGGGFEWFGNDPAHSVLTAYGLMEFHDMAQVHDVDPKLIDRTREWLLEQRNDKGTWQPTQGGIAEGAINAQQGQLLRTTAYIAWAVAETGKPDSRLSWALDFLSENWAAAEDHYARALCANAFIAAGRMDEAKRILGELKAVATEKDKKVSWPGAETGGLMLARGHTASIEATALVAYAMLRGRVFTDTAHKALAWLIEQKDSRGTWHSTQATVLAMRALLAVTGAGGSVDDTQQVTITANGALVKELEITPENSDVFHLVSLRSQVKEGVNRVALEASEGGSLAYQIVARHYLPWAEGEPSRSEPEETLSIDVAYDTTRLKPKDLLTCNVTLRYNRPGTAEMTLVDLGIPPGFEVQTGGFETLKKQGTIKRYTITGRQVTLYFQEIEGRRDLVFSYQLKARYPLRAKTPVTVAYQYYEPEVRSEAQPVLITVQ